MAVESSRAIAEVAREIQVNEGTLGRRLVSGMMGSPATACYPPGSSLPTGRCWR
jgi:hypothetical protein